MDTITESLERSLQNCSLNHNNNNNNNNNSNRNQILTGGSGGKRSASYDHPSNSGETTVELNSHISLPYHWEQCLDLKTGEIYYINWSNGMKAREDPRTRADTSGDLSLDEEDDDDCSYDSEESSPDSSQSSSLTNQHCHLEVKEDQVLVVAGCKSCFMYYMVPKLAGDCPKCSGHLLHFDQSQNKS